MSTANQAISTETPSSRNVAENNKIKKKSSPKIFRHSRATFLAPKLTEYQMCAWFGWCIGSDKPAHYIKLSGKDLEKAAKEINERQDVELKPVKCPECGILNLSGHDYCKNCHTLLNIKLAAKKYRPQVWWRGCMAKARPCATGIRHGGSSGQREPTDTRPTPWTWLR